LLLLLLLLLLNGTSLFKVKYNMQWSKGDLSRAKSRRDIDVSCHEQEYEMMSDWMPSVNQSTKRPTGTENGLEEGTDTKRN
jgi:hypothetical protein